MQKIISFHQFIVDTYRADFRDAPISDYNHPKISNKEVDWTSVIYLMFCIAIEHKSSCDTFFLLYFENITNFLYWVLWTCIATLIKKGKAILYKLIIICMQKMNSIPNFFFEIL